MIRSVLIALAMFFLLVAPAFSANIGPIKPNVSAGDMYTGLGYSKTDSKWQEDNGASSDLEMDQNRFFAQFGLAFSDAWAGYVRAGIATLDASAAFSRSADFEGTDPMPFATVGVNGVFFSNKILSIGGFVQGSYFVGEAEDSVQYTDVLANATAELVTETVTIDKMWEGKAGIQFQKELEGAQLYGGPMFYTSEAEIERNIAGSLIGPFSTSSKTVEEENNFGVVVGVQWQLLEDVSLDLEAQMRSSYDVGFVLNKRF